jgi:DNA repair protein RadC
MTDLICDLPADERPRERLLMHGAETLSSTELIAVLIGSGTRGKNALQLARELLGTTGVAALSTREVQQVAKTRGMGAAKAARIFAAFELSRRLTSKEIPELPLYELHEVGAKLVQTSSRHRQERLGALFLDSRRGILKQREIFRGTLNKALVSTREIIRYALEDDAAAIVLYHNHPSGNCTPSLEDRSFTTKMKESLALLDIELVDHLIVGSNAFYSMHTKGLC